MSSSGVCSLRTRVMMLIAGHSLISDCCVVATSEGGVCTWMETAFSSRSNDCMNIGNWGLEGNGELRSIL